MVLPRSTALRGAIRSYSLPRAALQARTSLRGVARRTYASEHGANKGSDIPWLIGSIAVTVPATLWLLQQGPKKSDHGHGHDSHKAEEHAEEAPEEESKEEPEEEAKEEAPKEEEPKEEESKEEEPKEEEPKEEAEGDSKSEKSDEESSEGSSSGGEKKGDKDAQGDISHANHPDIANPEKSKKAEGVPETAKIHGTVDSSRPVGGKKET